MWFRRRVAGGTRPSGGVSRALVTAILAVGLTTVGVPTKPMVYIDPLASTTGRSEVGPAPPGTKLDCRIDFLPVKPVVGVGSIIGTASAYCSVAPDGKHSGVALIWAFGCVRAWLRGPSVGGPSGFVVGQAGLGSGGSQGRPRIASRRVLIVLRPCLAAVDR
jgi:hypothetical protein